MFISIVIFSAVTQALVAMFILQKNRKSLTNVLFFCLSILLVTWAIINFIITKNPFSSSQLVLYRLLMTSVVVQNTFFFMFAHTYPGRTLNVQRKWLKLYLGLSLLAIAAALSPLLFTDVHYGAAGARPVTGPGMLLFVLHAGTSVIWGLRSIYKRYIKAHGLARQQLRLIFFGSLILWGIVPITNFVITMATQTLFFARISPLYTLAFSTIIAYAIVATKLFDIRAAVARSVAYLFSVLLLSLLYIVPSILLVALIMHIHFTWPRFAAGVGVALFFAMFYGYVRERFNTFTNKLFLRGYYEPQEVLNRLSDLLVGSIEVDELKAESLKILQQTFLTKNGAYWLIADHPFKTERALHRLFQANKSDSVLVMDELEGDPETEVVRELRDANVAVVVRLRTTQDDLGFLTVGYKESGELYSEKDKRLLSIAADEIAISLQNALHFQQIQDFNRTLQERVIEATKELRRTNEKLKALDETKDDFISMASHQLRTPLTSVKGYLSMVLEGDAGKVTPMQRKMLEQAFISSQRMVYLIADLLNVSRLKTGKFVIETMPTDLATVVQDEVNQLVETAQSREITLSYAKPHDFPLLLLDETKTRQVVMNFIDNAIYYTPAGGHITVELADKPMTVELRIVDDGIGVPKSEQHHLFTKFYRAGNARKARPDGTGLGLFMAKKVIVAQGGSIIFESKEGKGSTFGFTFGKSKLLVEPAPTPSVHKRVTHAD